MVKIGISDTIVKADSLATTKLSYKDSVLKIHTPQNWVSWFDSASYYHNDSISYVASVFGKHELKTTSHHPLARPQENRNWLFGLLFIITVLYVYIQTNFYNRYSQVKRAFLVKRYYSLLIRDGNIFKERIVIPILFIFLTSLALVIYATLIYLVDVSQISLSKFNLYLVILGCVILYQLGRSFFINLLGKVFYTRNETETYILDNLLFKSFLSLFLLPLLWFFIFSGYSFLLIAIWTVIIVLSVIRILKAVNNWSGVFTIFKLILYLCTLEILPIVILLKAIVLITSRVTVQ